MTQSEQFSFPSDTTHGSHNLYVLSLAINQIRNRILGWKKIGQTLSHDPIGHIGKFPLKEPISAIMK